MNILVTGGAGYIASISVKMLLDRGHAVRVIDTLENGFREAVDPRAEFVQGSLGEPNVYPELLKDIDAVLHCAGYINVAESVQNPEKYFFNNYENAKFLVDRMLESGVSKLVFSSTAAVYGVPEETPIDENAQLKPINPYGESKLAFENLLHTYEEFGINSIVFRYFNVAGADLESGLGERHNPETHIIPIFIERLSKQEPIQIFGTDYHTSDGTCVRDYIHVLDLAQAHCLALEALGAGAKSSTYNLGNSKGFSNLEIASVVADEFLLSDEQRQTLIQFAKRREGDPDILIASSEKAQAELGWKPQFSDIKTMVAHARAFHDLKASF